MVYRVRTSTSQGTGSTWKVLSVVVYRVPDFMIPRCVLGLLHGPLVWAQMGTQ